MPTYLYCLVSPAPDAAPTPPTGLGGAPVRRLPAGRVEAWVSDVASRSIAATAEGARAHDRVVRAALAGGTPLPARFGQTFAADDALRAALLEREDALVEALGRVRGAVEMTVRVLLDDLSVRPTGAPVRVSDTGSGKAYLARLRERHTAEEARRQRAEFLHDRVAAAVAGLVRDEVRVPPGRDGRSVAISHLVPVEAVDRYRAAVRALREGASPMRLLLSGPWAPYSFAAIPDE